MGKARDIAKLLNAEGDVKIENLDTINRQDAQPITSSNSGSSGYMSAEDKAKLDGIQQSATQDLSKEEIDHMGVDAATIDGKLSSDFVDVNLSNVNSVPQSVADQFRGVPFEYADLTEVQKTEICTGPPVPGPKGSGVKAITFDGGLGEWRINEEDPDGDDVFVPNLAYGTLEIILDTGETFSEKLTLEIPKIIENISRDGDLLSISMSDGEVKQFTIANGTDGDRIKNIARLEGDHHITFVTSEESGYETTYEIPIADGRGIVSAKRIDNTIRIRYTDGGEDYMDIRDGENGTAIESIVKAGSVVKITNTDGSQHQFEVKDGNQIKTMERDEITGLVTVTMTDGTKQSFDVPPGGLQGKPGTDAQLIKDITVDPTGTVTFKLAEVRDSEGVIASQAKSIEVGGFKGDKGDKGEPFDFNALSYLEKIAVKGPRGEVGPPGFTGAQGMKGEPGDSGSAIQGSTGDGILDINRDPNTGDVLIRTTGVFDAVNGETLVAPRYMTFKTIDGQSDKIISATRSGNTVTILTDAWSVLAQNEAQLLNLPIPGKYEFSIRDGIDGSIGETGPTGPRGPQGDLGDATKGDPGVSGGDGTTLSVRRLDEPDGDLEFTLVSHTKEIKLDQNGEPDMIDGVYQYSIRDSTSKTRVPLIDGSTFIETNKVPSPLGTTKDQFLTNDGSTSRWANLPEELPPKSGNDGLFLTTDGTRTKWDAVSSLPDQYTHVGKFLGTDGATASWLDVESVVTEIATAANVASGVSGTIRHNVTKTLLPDVDYKIDIPAAHSESGQYHMKQYLAGDALINSQYNMDLSNDNWTYKPGEIQLKGSQMLLDGVSTGAYINEIIHMTENYVDFYLMSDGRVLSYSYNTSSRAKTGRLCRSQSSNKETLDYVTHRLEEFVPIDKVVKMYATKNQVWFQREDGSVWGIGNTQNSYNSPYEGSIGEGGCNVISEITDSTVGPHGIVKDQYLNKSDGLTPSSDTTFVADDQYWGAGRYANTKDDIYSPFGRVFVQDVDRHLLDIIPIYDAEMAYLDAVSQSYKVNTFTHIAAAESSFLVSFYSDVWEKDILKWCGWGNRFQSVSTSSGSHNYTSYANSVNFKAAGGEAEYIPKIVSMTGCYGTQGYPTAWILDANGDIWGAGYYAYRFVPDNTSEYGYNEYGFYNYTKDIDIKFVEIKPHYDMLVGLDVYGTLWGGGYALNRTGVESAWGSEWREIANNVTWFSIGHDAGDCDRYSKYAIWYKVQGSDELWTNGESSGNGTAWKLPTFTNTGLTGVKAIYSSGHQWFARNYETYSIYSFYGRVLLKDYGHTMFLTDSNSIWNLPLPFRTDTADRDAKLADGSLDAYYNYASYDFTDPLASYRISSFVFDSSDQGSGIAETVEPIDLSMWGVIDNIQFDAINHSQTSIEVSISTDDKISWSPYYFYNAASQDINWSGMDFNVITSMHLRVKLSTQADHLTPILSGIKLTGKLKGDWCVGSLGIDTLAIREVHDNHYQINLRNETGKTMLVKLTCDLPVVDDVLLEGSDV